MKAISLWQPWATLVALGHKKIETRHWPISYRGTLAIHATKSFPKEVFDVFWNAHIRAALEPLNILRPHEMLTLPRGVVVATCELVECYRIPAEPRAFQRSDLSYFNIPLWLPPPEPELSFGNYEAGRYAWLLGNIQLLPEPVPARGAQGLWEWVPPEAVQ